MKSKEKAKKDAEIIQTEKQPETSAADGMNTEETFEPTATAQEDASPENTEIPENAAQVAESETAASADAAAAAQPVVYGDKVLTKSQKKKRAVLRWVLLSFGIILMSFSVYFFQTPNHFTLGGIAGLALVLGEFIPLDYEILMAIINVALLILGLIILGKQCTVRTIFCSLFYTGIIWLFEYFDIIEHINEAAGRVGAATLTDEPLMELVYAILLFGIGGAIVFNCGASSGGTDIIALILKKFTRLNVGMALMIIDMVIVLISCYTFSLEIGLFSVLGLFTKSFLLDGVIESLGKTKYITIITENHDIISDYILKVINHGYTIYDAEGGYTHKPKKVLVTVCKRNEALKLKMKIHQVDPTAFVIITDANEILGKGFGGTI
ncbi:MAG: YitT family protein [Clostridia bacterium]|jgi:uncharacterized membrane-anchored protein YitT (DUF2179 family)|nr:YitT family protein [Clostridia bacterium]